MSEWKSIKTAPKDGTYILLGGCKNGPPVQIGHWGAGRYNRSKKEYERDWAHGPNVVSGPTHWMPLPKPPKSTP